MTLWHVETTKAGDSVYVADAADLMPTTGSASRIGEVGSHDCRKPDGEPMPTAHVHLNGDCSPSRADVETLLGRPGTFGLVICGPRAVSGYVPQLFLLAMRGARHD